MRWLAARQEDVVAAWQLRNLGWTAGKIRHHLYEGGWRGVHTGVYALTSSPLTQRQLWIAAVLTAPGTVLSHGSAGACYGFHRFERDYEVVTRSGQGGRRRRGRLLVFRSKIFSPDITHHTGIPITTAARVLVDLAPGLEDKRLRRAFRESIRLRCTTAHAVCLTTERHAGRPGVRSLGALASRYAHIPYHRTRSDAEGLALEVLYDAGCELPLVNVKVAREEADLTWLRPRHIIEIDGPQYHRISDDDIRKAAIWRKAGFTVERISSDAVYDAPHELLELVPSGALRHRAA